MVAFPPCKINLGLNVVNRRHDGYHNIETCFYPLPRTDVLEIVPSVEFKLSLTGLKVPGSLQENICTKAYDLLKKDHALPAVAIHLHKTIPSGSGLGGGSSDGTWTLRMLDSMFNLRLPTPKLAEYATVLGSDCPFFLFDKPMIGTGRGEILSAVNLSLKGKVVVIVRPDVYISTKEAYQSVVPSSPAITIRSFVESVPLEKWRGKLTNQFEESVIGAHPVIGRIRQELYRSGALYSSMSGSGSAVYGIFNDEVNLASAFEGMDYWSGRLTV